MVNLGISILQAGAKMTNLKKMRLVALAILAAASLSACGSMGLSPNLPPRPEPAPKPTLAEFTKLPNATYQGQLPQYLPVMNDKKMDVGGEPQFYSTDWAVHHMDGGERTVRRLVVRTARLCFKAAIQHWALGEAQKQYEWTKLARIEIQKAIKNGTNLNYLLAGGQTAAGLALGGGPFYGLMMLLNGGQAANGNHMWELAMDQNDILIDLNMVMTDLYLGNVDLWLDALNGQYCKSFGDFTATHGTIVSDVPVS
jgi:hypothetical protein